MSRLRISEKADRVLRDVVLGKGTHYNCHGLSQHGGRAAVLRSLIRKGLLDSDYRLTDVGRAYLKSTWEE